MCFVKGEPHDLNLVYDTFISADLFIYLSVITFCLR
jgi:hypothetical protein